MNSSFFFTTEFKLEQKIETLIKNLKGTPLNYYRCINAFLKSVYSTVYSSFLEEPNQTRIWSENLVLLISPDYPSSLKCEFKSKLAFASLSDVLNAYSELTKYGKHEDALILHLTYSLGVNLETLTLFTYDSIDDDNNIKYFDTMKMEYVDAKLNEHIIRNISHFKEIMRNFKQEARDDYKCFKDKDVVMGDFIFDWMPSTIYNWFRRSFGGELFCFKYTPDKIVQLSKIKNQWTIIEMTMNHWIYLMIVFNWWKKIKDNSINFMKNVCQNLLIKTFKVYFLYHL